MDRFTEALLSLDKAGALKALEEFPGAEKNGLYLIEQLVSPALERIGRDWEKGELALSQVYMAGRLCEELVLKLLPKDSPERKNQPKLAVTVLEDWHTLGKKVVHSTLISKGFAVRDFGRTTADELVRKTCEEETELLLISTLMLPSALLVAKVKEALVREGAKTKVVVGGAPFRLDANLWREVGADATGVTAQDALSIVAECCGGEK